MKSPRLLPIVIFAGLALLAFKGIGIMTDGGYVLTGSGVAHAASETAGGPSVTDAAPRTEPTITDTSPTLTDPSPTLQLVAPKPEAGHVAAAVAAGHAAAPGADAGHAAPDAAAKVAADTTLCPAAPAAAGHAAPPAGTGCDVPTPVGPADAAAGATGVSATEQALLERLTQRRGELDKRAADLDMRDALVKAAEKQMQERADALKALQGEIARLHDEKQQMEDAQFTAIVTMYATMKPQDAATIFNGLEMGVLSRVAKAMEPRKMSAILAKMNAARAQDLTQHLASLAPPAADAPAVADSGALPQIVGH